MKKNRDKDINKIFNIITEIYIICAIIIYPLIVDNTGFFNILECKWNAYFYIMIGYISAIVILFLYFIIFKHINLLKNIKFTIVQLFIILFLLINIISTLFSPFKNYDLLYGVGRGEGLVMMSLYVISFLFITLFGRFNKRQILYFSISSVLLNLICILQYVGFNPFYMYKLSIGTHNVSFIGTIGNLDHVSALYTILLSISFAAFIFLDNNRYENIIHLLSITMGFFIFGIIDVDSGKLAFLCVLILSLPFIILNSKRLYKFLIAMVCFFFGYCINIIINPVYHYKLDKIIFEFQFNYIVVLFIIMMTFLLLVAYRIKNMSFDNTKDKKIIKEYYILLVIFGIMGVIALYFLPVKKGILFELHDILHGHFVDDYGTYRIFLWKRTFKIFPEYPVIGSGPDTFALRFMPKFTQDIMKIGPLTINDTAANAYLTMLINIGVLGLLSYLLFIGSLIIKGIKKLNTTSAVLLIGILCFIIQDFFNLWVVIIIPVYFALLGVYYNSIKFDKIDTKDNF